MNRYCIPPHKQQGAVLLVALIMLGIMALIGTATINSSYINKLLINNQLSEMQTEQIAHNLIETVLSDVNYFIDPASATAIGAPIDGRTVTVNNPTCIGYVEAGGYEIDDGSGTLIPEITYWSFDVGVSDPVTGAETQMHYGAKFKLAAGNCF